MAADIGEILVLGGSSFVGRELTERLGGKAIPTYNSSPFVSGIMFDATTMRITDIIQDPQAISHAIILVGDTQPNSCFDDKERSQAINVDGIERIIDDLIECDIRPVFTSSEFVFDGEKGGYVETDPAEPILLYGKQKLAIERYLQSVSDDFAILRLAKIFGVKPNDGTFFTSMLHAIEGSSEIRCAADQKFSPVYVGDVVNVILASIEAPLHGVFHVAGPEGKTRLQFLEIMINEVKKYRSVDTSINACSINDFQLPEARPIDVSMRPDKLVAATGISLLSAEEACQTICEELYSMTYSGQQT
jgi:dTDP-4-dehydrorhamnose reductase